MALTRFGANWKAAFGSHWWSEAPSLGRGLQRIGRRGVDYTLAAWRRAESYAHPYAAPPREHVLNVQDISRFCRLPEDWQAAAAEDPSYRSLLTKLQERERRLRASYPQKFNLPWNEALLLFALPRSRRPSAIVETGVGNGFSTAHFLAALSANSHGELHSVDYPPLHPERRRSIGILVPSTLRDRWHLHLDDSVRGLRRILAAGSTPDIFLHDSEHTYLQMRREYSMVFQKLPRGGLLISDDVTSNAAFVDFALSVGRSAPVKWGVLGRLGILQRA